MGVLLGDGAARQHLDVVAEGEPVCWSRCPTSCGERLAEAPYVLRSPMAGRSESHTATHDVEVAAEEIAQRAAVVAASMATPMSVTVISGAAIVVLALRRFPRLQPADVFRRGMLDDLVQFAAIEPHAPTFGQ